MGTASKVRWDKMVDHETDKLMVRW